MHIAGDVASHCRGITGASLDITGDEASHCRGASPGHHHITGDVASHYRRNAGVIAGHDAVGHTHASHCMGRRDRYMHVRAGGTLKLYTERTAKKAWCTTPSAWPRYWKKLYLISSQGSKDKSSCNNSTKKRPRRGDFRASHARLHRVRSIECSYRGET